MTAVADIGLNIFFWRKRMKKKNVLLTGISLAGFSLSALGGIDPVAELRNTPDQWTLEDVKRRCEMALPLPKEDYGYQPQLKTIKIEIKCEKIKRDWGAPTIEKTRLCRDMIKRADVVAKSRPVDLGHPDLERVEAMSDQFGVCHNFKEEVTLYRRTITSSCADVLAWESMSDALAECDKPSTVIQGKAVDPWVQQGVSWETLSEGDQFLYPELKPRSFSTCDLFSCDGVPLQR